MILTKLHDMVEVAQERHFGRTTAKTCVTQPALSLAIKKLKEELGGDDFRTAPESG